MASNLLWAHLLRKDATTTDSPPQIPPLAPQDKTGTSMRMLIHDTQANLETFSTRLDGLLHRVNDCRAHVVNATKLLDAERDKVLSEVLATAHRCQSELKAHLGTPAQAPALELVRASQASTERSVQALEKRIDALQTLLQTHVHAMQSIQDQQNTLIGAVLPLVPILNGVVPQMDQIKAALSDMVANAVSTMTKNVESVQATLVSEFVRAQNHMGPSIRATSSSQSIQEINVPASSPLDSHQRGPRLSLKRPRMEGRTRRAGNNQLPRKSRRFEVSLANSSDSPPSLLGPRTPRQPLADLLLPPDGNVSRTQHRVASPMGSTLHGYMHSRETPRTLGGPSTNVRLILRSPLQPLELARTRQRSPALHNIPSIDGDSAGAAGPSDPDIISRAIKIEEILEAHTTDVISIRSSPLSSPPASQPPGNGDPDELSASDVHPSRPHHSESRDDVLAPRLDERLQVPPPPSDPLPRQSMSLRDRRAQISRSGRTETRRFIQLVPWSDEEE